MIDGREENVSAARGWSGLVAWEASLTHDQSSLALGASIRAISGPDGLARVVHMLLKGDKCPAVIGATQ